MSKTKILIIGSEGSTGRAVFSTLDRKSTNDVFRMGRAMPKGYFNTERFICADLNDLQLCKLIQEKYCFDVVVYLAGIWRGKTHEISNLIENTSPFNNFINTIAKTAEHIIYFSSSAVYSGNDDFNEVLLSEIPDSSYGISKLLSEHLLVNFCKENSKSYTIFRPFHITSLFEKYNPGKSHVVTDFIYKINKGISLNSNGFQDIWIPFTWAYDVAFAVESALKNPKACNQIFNIGSSNTYSLAQLEKLVSCYLSQEGDGILEGFGLTPKKVKYFDKGNKVLGNYATTKLSEMVKYSVYKHLGKEEY